MVSLDLPCHGAERRTGEPSELAGWAARTARGENIAVEFCSRVNLALEHLVKTGVAAPEQIAAAWLRSALKRPTDRTCAVSACPATAEKGKQ